MTHRRWSVPWCAPTRRRSLTRFLIGSLVLDEPTASLDALTEAALFERYVGTSRSAGRASGAITLLVSHRFSTVRMADLSLVLHGWKIIETGSHEKLLQEGGLYAELFELQARSYR
jgi:ATP-binding cassette subfamily B protein